MNFQRIAAVAVSFACSTSMAAETLQPPWGKEENLGQKMVMEATTVCADGKGHYVAVVPDEDRGGDQLYYGDGKTFFLVPSLPFTSGRSFLEPRFFNKAANPNFRGMDWRVVSDIDLDKKAKTCALRCGEKNIALTVMEAGPAADVLRKSAFAPSPHQFAPYALLRDTKGNYYFVDRGTGTPDQKNYRVFIGPRGALKAQKMTNVISDSEGEIFSTKKGDLRLVLDKAKTSVWIENKKKSLELRQVPVEENLPLIYNDLGVYEGVRLGTPCDDQ
ncbi:hypothetical protein NVS55_33070 [Myxococcus stipitatus]|uniref:hypothetical protein n=1 Tax=Myxococcus stipitatus TaxID=83455 RepID=UPI00314552EA